MKTTISLLLGWIAGVILVLLVCFCARGQGQVISTLPVNVVTCSKTNVFTVKGKVITDYSSTKYESWRFVTDGKVLIGDVFHSGSVTYSPYKIIECKTLDLATNQIVQMGLKLTGEQMESISNLVERVSQKIDDGKIDDGKITPKKK